MNKINIIKKIIISIILIMAFSQATAAQYYTENTATFPYQYNVTISNSSGTNNATNVFLNGNAGTNFSSVYFTNANGSVTFPHCVLDNNTGKTWVNITQAGTFRLNYGNLSRSNSEDCSATFYQFQDNTTTDFLGALTVNYVNTAFEAKVQPTNTVHDLYFGLARATVSPWGNGAIFIQTVTASNLRYIITRNAATDATQNEAPSFTNATDADLLITLFSATYHAYVDGNEIGVGTALQLPSTPMGLYFRQQAGTGRVHYAFARNYTSPEPTITTWSNTSTDEALPTTKTCDTTTDERAITQDDSNLTVAGVTTIGQSFITLSDMYNITAIYVYFPSTTSANELRLWTNSSKTEQLGNTVTNLAASGWVRYAFSSDVIVSPSTSYYFEFTPLGAETWQYSDANPYILGSLTADGTNYPTYDLKFRIYTDNRDTTLISPTNLSVISVTYPPLNHDVDFSWENSCSYSFNFQVAEDSAFDVLEYDLSLTANTTTKAVGSGSHYWRVRIYNSNVTGNWSDTFTFSITEATPSISGTAINGVVFEYIGGVQTPINAASVYLTNSTYTTQALTGSNGYFLFTGLDNASTYSLYSIKQGYDNSQVFAVTPANNSTTTVNLPMRIYISPYVPNFVFEKFIVRSLFDEPYVNVTVNIYVGSALNPSFTGQTDSMGQVVFQLIKDTYYRIELSGGGLPETITAYFYGKEETYLITVASGFPDGGDKFNDINATLFVTDINATHANLSLYYSDNSSTTSVINFYAQYYGNGTAVCSDQSSATYPVTLNCTVLKANMTYLFGWNSTSSQYGFSQGADVVDFQALAGNAISGLKDKMDSDMLNWISILSLIFIAGLFSAKSVRYGAVVVPFAAVMLYWAGVFQVSAILVHSALILGIMAYLRMSENKGDMK